jgi:hypothetical protein
MHTAIMESNTFKYRHLVLLWTPQILWKSVKIDGAFLVLNAVGSLVKQSGPN